MVLILHLDDGESRAGRLHKKEAYVDRAKAAIAFLSADPSS
jgi:hypothetical protein